jgi:hypothetical protein
VPAQCPSENLFSVLRNFLRGQGEQEFAQRAIELLRALDIGEVARALDPSDAPYLSKGLRCPDAGQLQMPA